MEKMNVTHYDNLMHLYLVMSATAAHFVFELALYLQSHIIASWYSVLGKIELVASTVVCN
jgi:hypothetical protein